MLDAAALGRLDTVALTATVGVLTLPAASVAVADTRVVALAGSATPVVIE